MLQVFEFTNYIITNGMKLYKIHIHTIPHTHQPRRPARSLKRGSMLCSS